MNLHEIKFTSPGFFHQLSLKDILFLHYSCPQQKTVLHLYSKYIQFNFTLSGKQTLKKGDHQWTVTPKNGLIVKKCTFMQDLEECYEDWDVLIFYIRDNYLRFLFEEFRPHLSLEDLPKPSEYMLEPFSVGRRIRNSYQSFIPYISGNSPLPERIFEYKFKELFFNILSHPKNKHVLSYVEKIKDHYQTAIWEVMEANYMHHLKIRDFADIANRSLSAFKRDFEKHYHTSPGKWLTKRRLQRAMDILQSGHSSIGEVAIECGFKNLSHFSRVFKERYGMAPSHFQEK